MIWWSNNSCCSGWGGGDGVYRRGVYRITWQRMQACGNMFIYAFMQTSCIIFFNLNCKIEFK